MTVRISVTLPQFRPDAGPLLAGARRAEALGFDGVYVFDHLMPLDDRRRPIIEGTVAWAAVAAATRRLQVGTLVLRAPIRPPAVAARAAWTVQAMSGGRAVLGLGAADRLSRDEFRAYGFRYGSAEERIASVVATTEALDAVAPPELARPPVWYGGWSPSLRRAALAHADGWNGWGHDLERFRAVAAELQDERPDLTITWGGQVMLARDGDELTAFRRERPDPVSGLADEVVDRLGAFVEAGAQELVVALLPAFDAGDVADRFAEMVVPALRA